MAGDNAQPAWRDPLLAPPPRPVGTGTGAYVEQLEPQPAQYTIEGEIAMLGKFAQGAAHAPGWRGTLGRMMVGLLLGGFFAGMVVAAIGNLFR